MPVIPRLRPSDVDVICIGSSTGGPEKVEAIVRALPADLPVPILVAQHLPETFTRSFAAQLDRCSPLSGIEAENHMPLLPAVVYVGRGRQHLRVVRSYRGAPVELEVSPEPGHLLYKPSADELFASAAKVFGRRVVAVVLSGMGSDGAIGAKQLHDVGGMVLTQSRATCAVWGMPKAAVQIGASDAELDAADIARTLLQLSPSHAQAAAAG